MSFQFETFPGGAYQPAAVVNYPNNYDYTRITEFRHFYRQNVERTVIAKEYPHADGEPSYPIPTKENQALLERYQSLPHGNVSFIGRLGEYRYYSMDQIVEKCFWRNCSRGNGYAGVRRENDVLEVIP